MERQAEQTLLRIVGGDDRRHIEKRRRQQRAVLEHQDLASLLHDEGTRIAGRRGEQQRFFEASRDRRQRERRSRRRRTKRRRRGVDGVIGIDDLRVGRGVGINRVDRCIRNDDDAAVIRDRLAIAVDVRISYARIDGLLRSISRRRRTTTTHRHHNCQYAVQLRHGPTLVGHRNGRNDSSRERSGQRALGLRVFPEYQATVSAMPCAMVCVN